jgi:bifunctional polynucleotide phosphatase/kinase
LRLFRELTRSCQGKSFYYKKLYEPKGYVRINQDTLKTKAKCISKTKEELDSGSSVVIDNTNPDPATRKEYVKIAKQYSVPLNAYTLMCPKKFATTTMCIESFTKKTKREFLESPITHSIQNCKNLNWMKDLTR